jgi:hypothetical protein
MHARVLITLLGTLAVLGVVAGCGGKRASPAATTVPTTTAVSHAAPDLEARLPAAFDGHRLEKGSATGAVVLSGGDAFSRELKRILAREGKLPAALRFANAQDPTGRLELEVGAFEVHGMNAQALRDAIVQSSRPNAPGLAVTRLVLAGKPVTKLVYPGGSTLYLYPHDPVVYYVGTPRQALAERILARLP